PRRPCARHHALLALAEIAAPSQDTHFYKIENVLSSRSFVSAPSFPSPSFVAFVSKFPPPMAIHYRRIDDYLRSARAARGREQLARLQPRHDAPPRRVPG